MSEGVIIAVGMSIGIPLAVYGLWLTTHTDRRLQQRGRLCSAAANLVLAVANALIGNTVAAAVGAAIGAWLLWQWWNGGGGDGLKRRLKKWAGAFGPRLAPQSA